MLTDVPVFRDFFAAVCSSLRDHLRCPLSSLSEFDIDFQIFLWYTIFPDSAEKEYTYAL